jgi:hypothetical protein
MDKKHELKSGFMLLPLSFDRKYGIIDYPSIGIFSKRLVLCECFSTFAD